MANNPFQGLPELTRMACPTKQTIPAPTDKKDSNRHAAPPRTLRMGEVEIYDFPDDGRLAVDVRTDVVAFGQSAKNVVGEPFDHPVADDVSIEIAL